MVLQRLHKNIETVDTMARSPYRCAFVGFPSKVSICSISVSSSTVYWLVGYTMGGTCANGEDLRWHNKVSPTEVLGFLIPRILYALDEVSLTYVFRP
jgi:hypothetical protein